MNEDEDGRRKEREDEERIRRWRMIGRREGRDRLLDEGRKNRR